MRTKDITICWSEIKSVFGDSLKLVIEPVIEEIKKQTPKDFNGFFLIRESFYSPSNHMDISEKIGFQFANIRMVDERKSHETVLLISEDVVEYVVWGENVCKKLVKKTEKGVFLTDIVSAFINKKVPDENDKDFEQEYLMR